MPDLGAKMTGSDLRIQPLKSPSYYDAPGDWDQGKLPGAGRRRHNRLLPQRLHNLAPRLADGERDAAEGYPLLMF